jgi:glycyl-tRNA synthetase (class II)
VTVDVQTVGDEKGPADEKATIRDRNSMEQIRVPVCNLEAIMADLMEGKWAEVAKTCPRQAASSLLA